MPTWNMCVCSQELIYCQGTNGCPHLQGFFSKLFKQRMSWHRILEERTQMLTHRQSEAGELIRTGTHSADGCSPIVTFCNLLHIELSVCLYSRLSCLHKEYSRGFY